MIRSWGSMPMLFGAGNHLMTTAASHYIYTRREGCLHVELIKASCATVAESDDTFVRLSLTGAGALTGSKKRGKEPEYNDIFQFAWEEGAEEVKGRALTIKIVDDNMVIDQTLGETTIRFASKAEGGGEPAAAVTELGENTVVALEPGAWAHLQGVKLGNTLLWLNVRWTPPDAPLPPTFQCGEGGPGCGCEHCFLYLFS